MSDKLNSRISLLISTLVNRDTSLGNIGYYLGKYFGAHQNYNTWLAAWPESKVPMGIFDTILVGKKYLPDYGIDVMLRNSGVESCFPSERIQGVKSIAYVYYDKKEIDSEIIKSINSQLDILITPSNFTKNRFLKFGVIIPIEVIPLAVDINIFQPVFREQHKKFTFLNYGEQGIRKGTDILIKAFQEEFSETEAELKLISHHHDCSIKETSNLKFIDKNLTLKELILNINDADCFIALTREDSFGMCGLESMACGLPVIASENSGYAEYVNENNGYLVPCQKSSIPVFEYEPNLQYAKKIMRKAYINFLVKNSWRDKKINAENTARNLSWEKFGENFDNLIQKYKQT